MTSSYANRPTLLYSALNARNKTRPGIVERTNKGTPADEENTQIDDTSNFEDTSSVLIDIEPSAKTHCNRFINVDTLDEFN